MMRRLTRFLAAMAMTASPAIGFVAGLFAPPHLVAQPPAMSRSLDQQLLEGLAPPKPTPPAAENPSASQSASHPSLAGVVAKMRTVSAAIANRDTSQATQTLQRQIVGDLAALLKQPSQSQPPAGNQPSASEQSKQAAPGTGNPTPAQPGQSTTPGSAAESPAGEPVPVRQLLTRVWGHLPPKLREQLQASLSEQFLPQYESLIEDYYRRLAEDEAAPP